MFLSQFNSLEPFIKNSVVHFVTYFYFTSIPYRFLIKQHLSAKRFPSPIFPFCIPQSGSSINYLTKRNKTTPVEKYRAVFPVPMSFRKRANRISHAIHLRIFDLHYSKILEPLVFSKANYKLEQTASRKTAKLGSLIKPLRGNVHEIGKSYEKVKDVQRQKCLAEKRYFV